MNDRADPPFTRDELLALPAAVDVPTAARAIGISRTKAYELIRDDAWPTPTVRVGRLIKVPMEPILTLLGIRHERPNLPSPRRPHDQEDR